MLAFSNDYYGFIFRATQSVELFCAYVTRYHSLIVDHNNLPSCLSATAFADDGVLMAISHKQYPIYGIQFHPEAVLTEHGYDLIENYIKLCREWRKDHERDY